MNDQTSRIEVIWGHRLLDDGFTSLPNILIRNYRKLDISHGEWGFICTLLTYKHDERDPYPSQETLADHLEVSVRQIKKWVLSLVEKQLLLVGQRRNTKNRQFGSAVYNFKPLIQATLKLIGEQPLPETKSDWDIEYRNPSVLEVHTAPKEPQVHLVSVLEVPTDPVPEVHPKRTSNKTTNENNNKVIVVAVQKEIEIILGSSIRTIKKLIPHWIEQFGPDNIIQVAQYIASTRDKYDNIIGAFRAAVETGWMIHNETAATRESIKDERYANFYKLFPDT